MILVLGMPPAGLALEATRPSKRQLIPDVLGDYEILRYAFTFSFS